MIMVAVKVLVIVLLVVVGLYMLVVWFFMGQGDRIPDEKIKKRDAAK